MPRLRVHNEFSFGSIGAHNGIANWHLSPNGGFVNLRVREGSILEIEHEQTLDETLKLLASFLEKNTLEKLAVLGLITLPTTASPWVRASVVSRRPLAPDEIRARFPEAKSWN